MHKTDTNISMAEIEIEARRLQAEAVAAMFRALANRLRAALAGAPVNTGTGRTA